MNLDDGGFAFIAQQEVAALHAIHKPVLSQYGSTSGMSQDIEVFLNVRVSIGIVEAHPVAGEDFLGRFAKTVGKSVALSLSRRSVAAPAGDIVPAVAVSGGVDVNGDKADILPSNLFAEAVDTAATLVEGDAILFWYEKGSEEMFSLESGHDTGGDFTVVGIFQKTTVRGTLARGLDPVAIVDEYFHGL